MTACKRRSRGGVLPRREMWRPAPGGVAAQRAWNSRETRARRGMGARHAARARTATSSGRRTTRRTAARADEVVEGGRGEFGGGRASRSRRRTRWRRTGMEEFRALADIIGYQEVRAAGGWCHSGDRFKRIEMRSGFFYVFCFGLLN